MKFLRHSPLTGVNGMHRILKEWFRLRKRGRSGAGILCENVKETR